MTPEAQRIAIAEACGWNSKPTAFPKDAGCGCSGKKPEWNSAYQLPDYPRSFKDLREAEIALGLHDTDNLELRVKWINSLRMVVSRRCPKNNSGTPIVSDIDLLNASEEERCEALVRAIGKWPKKNLQTQNQQNKGTKNERTNNTN